MSELKLRPPESNPRPTLRRRGWGTRKPKSGPPQPFARLRVKRPGLQKQEPRIPGETAGNRAMKVQYSMGGGKCCLTPLATLSMMQRGRVGTHPGERAKPRADLANQRILPRWGAACCAPTEARGTQERTDLKVYKSKRNPRAARLPDRVGVNARTGSTEARETQERPPEGGRYRLC